MQRKKLALLLAATMILSLTACSGTSETKESDTKETAKEQTKEVTGEAAEETADGELVIDCWSEGRNSELILAAAKSYEEQTGKKVTINITEMGNGDIAEQLTVIAESNTYDSLPDMMQLTDENYGIRVQEYPDVLMDLTSYADFDGCVQSKIRQTTHNGKHYGFPIDLSTSFAYYRTDILEKAGYKIDDLRDITWDEYIEIGKVVKEKTGYYLTAFGDIGGANVLDMMMGTNVDLFDEDGNCTIAGNEKLYECAELAKKVSDSGIVFETNEWSEYQMACTDQAAGYMQGCWMPNEMASNQSELKGIWAVANIPAVDENSAPHGFSGGSSWCISNYSEKKEAVAEFLAYMFVGDGLEAFAPTYCSIGFIPSRIDLLESGFFDKLEDPAGYYTTQFYSDEAKGCVQTRQINSCAMYQTAINELKGAMQEISLEGADVKSAIDAVQDSIEFQME